MSSLPTDINPAAYAEKRDDDSVALFGLQSPLSNHHPATFKLDGHTYNYTEQYLMKEKAMLFSKETTAVKIMASRSPTEMKQFGRSVEKSPLYDERRWHNIAPKIMEKALYEKFSQNKHIGK